MLVAKIDTTDVMLGEKTFKTGSRGFHGTSKISIGNKRYQANVLLVEIGSKPTDSNQPIIKADGTKVYVEGATGAKVKTK